MTDEKDRAPEVKPGDWISIGRGEVDGVVSKVYDQPGRAEAVYLDSRKHPIAKDVVWSGERWKFTMGSLYGRYAESMERLEPFIEKLQAGRPR